MSCAQTKTLGLYEVGMFLETEPSKVYSIRNERFKDQPYLLVAIILLTTVSLRLLGRCVSEEHID